MGGKFIISSSEYVARKFIQQLFTYLCNYGKLKGIGKVILINDR